VSEANDGAEGGGGGGDMTLHPIVSPLEVSVQYGALLGRGHQKLEWRLSPFWSVHVPFLSLKVLGLGVRREQGIGGHPRVAAVRGKRGCAL